MSTCWPANRTTVGDTATHDSDVDKSIAPAQSFVALRTVAAQLRLSSLRHPSAPCSIKLSSSLVGRADPCSGCVASSFTLTGGCWEGGSSWHLCTSHLASSPIAHRHRRKRAPPARSRIPIPSIPPGRDGWSSPHSSQDSTTARTRAKEDEAIVLTIETPSRSAVGTGWAKPRPLRHLPLVYRPQTGRLISFRRSSNLLWVA